LLCFTSAELNDAFCFLDLLLLLRPSIFISRKADPPTLTRPLGSSEGLFPLPVWRREREMSGAVGSSTHDGESRNGIALSSADVPTAPWMEARINTINTIFKILK
jgi:hypothetical protein